MNEDYDLIDLSRLRQDPFNVRATYRGIRGLADTILEHGLLQNLVVAPNPKEPGTFIIRAGNRRFKALCLLAQEKRLADTLIPCLVVDETRRYDQVVENLQREEIPIWDYGARFSEWSDAGLNQEQIANKVGKNQGFVSRAIKIWQGLHPAIIEQLRKLPNDAVSATGLMRLAALPRINDFGDHDLKRQQTMLDFYLSKATNKPKHHARTGGVKMLVNRYKNLQKTQVPRVHYRTYSIIMQYLSGKSKTLEWDSDGIYL